MKNSIKTELAQHILDLINDGVLKNSNKDDWHFLAFNEDYYMIGYYECSEWLKKHGIGEFEAAGICTQYEIDNFGESTTVYDNSEKAVNMLAYIYGEELLGEIGADTKKELKKAVKEIAA
ncbi:MAG: hypothetical protein KDD03_13175 [Gelidibacter sp.]|nr:hypothetical protein [Gelidibacter sp.]